MIKSEKVGMPRKSLDPVMDSQQSQLSRLLHVGAVCTRALPKNFIALWDSNFGSLGLPTYRQT